ncbi:MAG TPA: SCP2 sterol-binding domain-containing protein [Actinomycetota bacterium]|nr:SCP2 sterol-binding domain-containing protein [Actinomycetota bacterium]
MVETMVSDERKWLAGSLEGLSDAEILDFVRLMGGADPLVELVFLLMPRELNPEVAEDGVIGWDVRTADRTYAYRTEIRDGQLDAEAGRPASARVRLAMSLTTFFRLVTDLQDAQQAFDRQELTVEGDLAYALRLQGMFRTRPMVGACVELR